MTVGKSPHRPQGKTKDAEHMGPISTKKGLPYTAPSKKEVADTNRDEQAMRGGPARIPAEEQRGGSRPGVESRIKKVLEQRDEWG